MSNVPHIPAIRLGRNYESLDKVEVKDHRSGAVLATVSQVNGGIVKRDMAKIGSAREALRGFTVAQLIELSAKAGELFLNGTLPLGDQGHTQSPQQYVETLSLTSGLPHVMVRRNMAKIHYALTHMPFVLNGLSRGLDFSILDRGFGEQFGTKLSFMPTCQALGLVMPSNSPAVNSLWIPAIALKTPVVIKPGKEEPWTPYRLIQAFIAAGVPAEAFGFYPTDHDGAATILNQSAGGRLIFGDKSTTQQYASNPAIQIHGPGLEQDSGRRRLHRELARLHRRDGQRRSATTAGDPASTPARWWCPGMRRRSRMPWRRNSVRWSRPRPDDENARLSGFANPKMADFIDGQIEEGLKTPGAEDVTAKYRGGPRKVVSEGGTYMRPTIVRCDSFQHPLANREFLCPYASVVTVVRSRDDACTKSATPWRVRRSPRTRRSSRKLEAYPEIERLNIGPVSTMAISWDQPHEGNMFEFLWKRRSIERAW
ncbi:MAG: aldehyde dehydrogenase family protein [Cypionkella sp.]